MDKSRFIMTAPAYCALAICTHLGRSPSASITASSLRDNFTVVVDESFDERYCYLEKDDVLEQAIRWLEGRELIDVIPDDFGPAIYKASAQWTQKWQDLLDGEESPFNKYRVVPDGDEWLRSALRSLNTAYEKLGITKGDFDKPDDEWQPLPLDRHDPQLRKVVAAIDETIDHVRADNGYSVSFPEEKDYIVGALSSASQRFKEAAHVSVGYARRYVLEPLETLIRRFSGAAIGVTASGAREALIEFLKQKGIKLLTWIFS